MIELLSSDHYRDQFNGVEFPTRCSEFVSILIEFSIERSIMWDIDRDYDCYVELSTTNHIGNSIEVDFNDESHADLIDCWVASSDGMKEFSFNTVEEFNQFLIDNI